ncbi:GFA family protein [Thalassotalea sediminis]|uniref:GFA family protein n=1 Tax=Thalassotalea sediminis TaxID=1759089 RepID=UPI00257433D2|nr:GFA family protein [Thalassotalea sediminis]
MANIASCLCGKIVFKVEAFLPAVAHCHCSMCRKFHGAAFSTFAEVSNDKLLFVQGKPYLQSYVADNNTVRKFCKCCGSSLIFESTYNRADNTIEVALAAFDQLEAIKPTAHIYVANKAAWFEITDKVPQFKNFRE